MVYSRLMTFISEIILLLQLQLAAATRNRSKADQIKERTIHLAASLPYFPPSNHFLRTKGWCPILAACNSKLYSFGSVNCRKKKTTLLSWYTHCLDMKTHKCAKYFIMLNGKSAIACIKHLIYVAELNAFEINSCMVS